MSGEIVPIVVETVQRGLALLNENKETISGAVMLVEVTRSAGRLVAGAVKPLFPLLAQHYLGASAPAQVAAGENVLSVSSKIRDLISESMADGRLTQEQIETAVSDPAFAVSFKTALLKASESNTELRQNQFAQLVVAQMSKPPGSHAAQVLNVATRLLADLTDRQLLLLGAITVSLYVTVDGFELTGPVEADYETYANLCAVEVAPYLDAQIRNEDIRYLEALNLLTLKSSLVDRHTSPMLNAIGIGHLMPATHGQKEVFARLNQWISGDRLNGKIGFGEIHLTQPAWVLGAAVHAHLRNRPLDISGVSN